MKNNSALFYTCSLIEFIGREQKLRRSELVSLLGEKTIARIYRYADVFHCEPIEKAAGGFIENKNIPRGSYDNVAACRYTVPDYWTIGEALSNYNTDFYYQSWDYIFECYKEGKIGA